MLYVASRMSNRIAVTNGVVVFEEGVAIANLKFQSVVITPPIAMFSAWNRSQDVKDVNC